MWCLNSSTFTGFIFITLFVRTALRRTGERAEEQSSSLADNSLIKPLLRPFPRRFNQVIALVNIALNSSKLSHVLNTELFGLLAKPSYVFSSNDNQCLRAKNPIYTQIF